MTKVAVVGSGFVAGLVGESLRQRNVSVRQIHAPRITGSAETTIEQVRSAHTDTIRQLSAQLANADVVINAAGIPDASAGDSGPLFGANSVLPAIVGLAALQVGARRFVHVSSAVVQGRRPTLDESWAVEAFSPYSSSKILGERLAVAAAPGIATVYRPPSVHARDRRVTRTLTRIARSPISSVAGRGDRPTPQALAENVGDAIAHLALTPSTPATVVSHPSEGLTTGSLLALLGGHEPHHIPVPVAELGIRVLGFFQNVVPAGRAHLRRLEMVWFGQQQSPSWLTNDGWQAPAPAEEWGRLGRPDGGGRGAEHASRPSIMFGVTTGIVVRSFFTGQLAMLRDHGWDVSVVATPENGAREAAISEGADFVEVRAVRDTSPLRDLKTLLFLIRLLRARKPDLAVWGTPKVGLLGILASRLTGGRCVYVLHGLRLETTTGYRRFVLTITERLAAHLAQDVVAVGFDLRERAEQLQLAPQGKVQVLGHGSANGVLVTSPPPGSRYRLELPEDRVVMGFVGRITYDKGVVELLKVWPEIHTSTGAHLALAGMREPDAFQTPIAPLLAGTPGVHYLGHLDDLSDLYDALDVLVLPSHREGLPTVVLEAAASGVPCVVSDATGASEPVEDEVTGLVVPVRNPMALQTALVRMASDPVLRERLGSAARTAALERYGRDVVHRHWLNFFEARRPEGEAVNV